MRRILPNSARDTFLNWDPTVKGQGTDYPYRASVAHAAFAKALTRITADINYPNFKDAVVAAQGKHRASVYGKVWSSLLALKNNESTQSPSPAPGALTAAPAAGTPVQKRTSYGGVIIDDKGRLLLLQSQEGIRRRCVDLPKGPAGAWRVR